MAKKKTARKHHITNRRLGLLALIFSLMALALVFNFTLGVTFDQLVAPFAIFTFEETPQSVVSVSLSPSIANIIDSRYKSDVNEFLYCMYGEVNSRYIVNEIRETQVLSSEVDTLTFEPCSRRGGYLGTIHSHPQPDDRRFEASCSMSRQDVFTFGKDGSALTAVICNPGEYGFYSSSDFDTPLGVLIG